MNGTYINKKRIDFNKEVNIQLDDKITFGRGNLKSSRRFYY